MFRIVDSGPHEDKDRGCDYWVIWGPTGEGNGAAAIIYDEIDGTSLSMLERVQACALALNRAEELKGVDDG